MLDFDEDRPSITGRKVSSNIPPTVPGYEQSGSSVKWLFAIYGVVIGIVVLAAILRQQPKPTSSAPAICRSEDAMNMWFPAAIVLAAASTAAPQEGVRQMAGQWMAVAADTVPVVGPAAILIEITATTLVINAAEGDPLVFLLPDARTLQTSTSVRPRCGKPLPARWESGSLTAVCDPDGDGTEAITTALRLENGRLVVTVRYHDRQTDRAEAIVQAYARNDPANKR